MNFSILDLNLDSNFAHVGIVLRTHLSFFPRMSHYEITQIKAFAHAEGLDLGKSLPLPESLGT